MPHIHPLAVVEKGAQLADDVTVGPFAYIGPRVTLGPGCVVHHRASIEGDTIAGSRNEFFPNSLVGGVPQDLKYKGGNCKLLIGSDNVFREAATVHIGTEVAGGLTKIGSHNLFMIGCHIAHDCIVGDHCILANNVLLAGHVCVEDYVVISGASAAHHFVTFGQHSFVGGLAAVTRDVPPFMVVDGDPAIVRGVNRNGLKRRGFTDTDLEALRTAYRLLFSDTTPLTTQAVELRRLYPDNPHITTVLSFMENVNKGKFGRYRESIRGKNGEEENNNTHPIAPK